MQRLFAVMVIFLVMMGCAGSPFSKDSMHTSGSAAGALIGGGAAVAGTAVLAAPRPLILGAGLGGMALGYYLTTLRFKEGPIIKAGGEVYTQGEYVGISIPCYQLFEANSSEFTRQAEALLDSAVAVLKRYPNDNILISGNAGGFQSWHADQKRSEVRARQVAAYLWAHGVNNFKNPSIQSRKLTFVGYGDYFPIANREKIQNVQKNSRIQITAYPSTIDLKLDQKSTVFNNVGGYHETDL